MDEMYHARKKVQIKKEIGKFNNGRNHKKPRWEEDSNASHVALNKPLLYIYIYATMKKKDDYLISYKAKINPEPRKREITAHITNRMGTRWMSVGYRQA